MKKVKVVKKAKKTLQKAVTKAKKALTEADAEKHQPLKKQVVEAHLAKTMQKMKKSEKVEAKAKKDLAAHKSQQKKKIKQMTRLIPHEAPRPPSMPVEGHHKEPAPVTHVKQPKLHIAVPPPQPEVAKPVKK